MIDPQLRQRAIRLYDRYTHEDSGRRGLLKAMIALAGSAASARLLIAGIAPDPAAAAIVTPGDPRVKAQEVAWTGANGHAMKGYSARPAGPVVKRPAVIVIHENRGLNDHVRDITRRLALAGFLAVAPDFLSPLGGTPADESAAREAIGKLDPAMTVADGVVTIAWLKRVTQSSGKVGTVGFCWGGAMVNRLAVAAGSALEAGVAFYGPAPDPAGASRVKAALMLHYAGLDDRVNASGKPWLEALKAEGVSTEAFIYPGVNHAFNNDTSADRYDKEAADLAWGRTIAFLRLRLFA